MINSTISGNSSGWGGGGLENIGTMSLSFVTISGNRTDTAGCCGPMADGILNFGIALTVKNSILANSTAIGNCLFYPGYPVTSQGHNLSDDTTCTIGFVQSSDINNTPAGLGTLQNNGGPTQTIALLAGSPAINAIPFSPTSFCTDVSAAAVTTDQRGITRPQGSACDIGAFEALALLQSQTISFGPLPNQAFGTAPLTVSATASSGLAVSFSSQTTSICTTTGTNGATVTLLGVGQCTIQATQGGGGNYAAANPVSRSFQVTQQGQTISFAALPNLPLGAAPFTVSATATSSLAVSFSSQTTSACTTSGTNGTTVTLVASAVGTCTIQATQGGNPNIAAATPVSQSFQVISLPQLVVTKSLSRNGTISVIVTVTNNGGSAASSVQLTAAKIGATATTTTLPATVGTGTIAGAGGSGQITVSFPGTVGTTGTATTLTLSGTYNGGSFGGTSRITLP